MRLAEALKEKADLSTRLEELPSRLENNAKVQQGESPAEDPAQLLKELEETASRFAELGWRINQTNASVRCKDGRSITQLIAERDMYKRKAQLLRGLIDSASRLVSRHSQSEIVVQSTVDVSALRKKADDYSKLARETDNIVQELNWTNDLL
ncbi:MAG: DIP1984 family protein [archaeon]|nr:DIP1984 family protein [archaeon]